MFFPQFWILSENKFLELVHVVSKEMNIFKALANYQTSF